MSTPRRSSPGRWFVSLAYGDDELDETIAAAAGAAAALADRR